MPLPAEPRDDSIPPGLLVHSSPQPLPRVPRKNADGDFELVYPSAAARKAAAAACEREVASNCIEGVRSACALRAVAKCQGPLLFRWLGLRQGRTCEEVEQCQDDFVVACVADKQPECRQHAQDFCTRAIASVPTVHD